LRAFHYIRNRVIESRRVSPNKGSLQNHIELEKLYQLLRKSEYGMPRQTFELIVAVLIKEGYLIGYKGVRPVDLKNARLPISYAVDMLVTGKLIDIETQKRITDVVKHLFGKITEDYNISVQESIWQDFQKLRSKFERTLQEVQHQLAPLASESSESTSEMENFLLQLRQLVDYIEPHQSSDIGLEKFASRVGDNMDALIRMTENLGKIQSFLKMEKSGYQEMCNYMDHPAFSSIPDQTEFADLNKQVKEVKALLPFSDQLVLHLGIDRLKDEFALFREQYVRMYAAAHEKVYQAVIIEKLKKIKQSPGYRAIRKFREIRSLPVSDYFKEIDEKLDQAIQSCCLRLNRNDLKKHPQCLCNFLLGDRPTSISAESFEKEIHVALKQYLKSMQEPRVRDRIESYMETLQEGAPAGKLMHLLNLLADLPFDHLASQIVSTMDSDVIRHINRALKGKIKVVERNISKFFNELKGRHFTKNGLRRKFEAWLEHSEDPIEDGAFIKISMGLKK